LIERRWEDGARQWWKPLEKILLKYKIHLINTKNIMKKLRLKNYMICLCIFAFYNYFDHRDDKI